MISWLLVAVLLFADNAITTPTSTSAEPPVSTATTLTTSTTTIAVAKPELVVQSQPSGDQDAGSRWASASGAGAGEAGQPSQLANGPPTQPDSEQALVVSNVSSAIAKEAQKLHHQQQQLPQTDAKSSKQKKIYTNQFVIRVEGGEDEARRLAEKHGFIYLNHILGDYYHLEHRRLAKRSLDSFDVLELDTSIQEEPHVSSQSDVFFCLFSKPNLREFISRKCVESLRKLFEVRA